MSFDLWKNILLKYINPIIDGFINKTIKKTFSLQFSLSKKPLR
jgi:hypothetical protein